MKKHTYAGVTWCNRGWQPLHYGFCPSEKKWAKFLKTYKIPVDKAPYPQSHGSTTFFDKGQGNMAVVSLAVAEHHTPAAIIGLIAHEASHVLDKVIELMGDDAPSGEFRAYAAQAITQELIEAYEMTCGRLVLKKVKSNSPR